MKLLDVRESGLKDKTVLVRVDYNVPLLQQGRQTKVADPRRILASFSTIEELRRHHNKVVLLAHFGRPKDQTDQQYSLRPIFTYLQRRTDWPLTFLTDPTLPAAKKAIAELPADSVILVENLRFWPGEQNNDPVFARQLAKLGDAYVNDAFSASHRAHASIVGLAKKLPAWAGISLVAEEQAFTSLLTHPRHPFIVVVGGAKISDKIDPIVNLSQVADAVLIGGGVANNFLKAVGLAVQKSYLQDTPANLKKVGVNYVAIANQIIEDNRDERLLKDGYIPLPKIIYPVDVVAAPSIESKRTQIVDLTSGDKLSNRGNLQYLDIGPKTVRLYKEMILQAKTVFWNGPMGVFEKTAFSRGTREVSRAVAKTAAVTVVGGGDTLAALDCYHDTDRIDYVSMAGGAALEFLSGKKLPGLEVLRKK